MVSRIAILLLLFFSIPAFSQEIKINNVGIKDLSNYMIKDFTFAEEIENLFILEDADSLSYMYFQSFRNELSIKELKKIVDYVKSEELRKIMEMELFWESKKRNQIDQFINAYNDKKLDEKIDLLIAIEKKNFNRRFSEKIFSDYLDCIGNFIKGNVKEALSIIEPYKNSFPYTYLFLLINQNEIKKAEDFAHEQNIEDEDIINLILFFKKDCKSLLDSKKGYGYLNELMKIECSVNNNMEYGIPEMFNDIPQNLSEDDFTIFRFFSEKKLLKDERIYPYYLNFYYRWKLLNYINYLDSYKSDIDKFVKRIEELKKEYREINNLYKNYWPKLDQKQEQTLRDKFNNLNKIWENVKNSENIQNIDIDVGILRSFLSQAMFEAKKKLIERYDLLISELKEEHYRLNLEREFRLLDKELTRIDNMALEEVMEKIKKLELLIKEGQKYNVSFIEKGKYDNLILLWYRYLKEKEIDEAKRTERLKEIIEFASQYLKNFPKTTRTDVYILLGEANEGIGNIDEALKNYLIFIDKNTKVPTRVFLKIGDIFFDKKFYDEARKYYSKVQREQDKYSFVANYKIAWTYYLQERYDDALKLLLSDRIYKVEDLSEVLLNEMIDLIAKVLYKLGPERDFDIYLKKYHTFPYPEKVFKSLGDLYASLADYKKAIEIYERGLKSYYMNFFSYLLLVSKIELLAFTGKIEEAFFEKLRFNNLYNQESLYYQKYQLLPSEYEEIVLSSAFYFSNDYEKNGNIKSFDIAEELFLDYLSSPLKNKKIGEISFLLAQLYATKRDFEKSSDYYYKAFINGFKTEESYYGYLTSLYNLWDSERLKSETFIENMKEFINLFPNSKYYLKINLLLSNVYLQIGNEKESLEIIDGLMGNPNTNSKDFTTILDFLKERFRKISDKEALAKLFNKGYEKTKNREFLEFKHYSLFLFAQGEEGKDISLAIKGYENIIMDIEKTRFTEVAKYNLAIIESRIGNNDKALELMKRVLDENLMSNALQFMLDVGMETKRFEIAGESAEKLAVLRRDKEMYFKSLELYLRSSKLEDAKRIIEILKNNVNEDEKSRLYVYMAVYYYKKDEYQKVISIIHELLKSRDYRYFDKELVLMINDVVRKNIFLLSDETAKDFIENYIEMCGIKYGENGDTEYLYQIGEFLVDFSTFFIDKESAIFRGKSFLKRSLKESVEKEEKEITVKSIKKLKSLSKDIWKEFLLPEVDFEKEIFTNFGI